MNPHRRQFLLTSAAAATVFTGFSSLVVANSKEGTYGKTRGSAHRLLVKKHSIEVNGRTAVMFRLQQPNGSRGLVLNPGENFSVNLENHSDEPTIVHWHGQTPPTDQDGVSQFGIPLLQPGEQRAYNFVARSGTYWMHSHHGFQHQRMLSAPLIVRTPDDVRADAQEVTIFLEDFLFRDPAEVFADLQKGEAGHRDTAPASGMANASMRQDGAMTGATMAAGKQEIMHGMKMDLNDIEFDAYLANDRTLGDPEVVRVDRGGKIRLRIINGASSTNFHIDLGSLQGTVMSVDGNPVKPLKGRRFDLAMAQRIDILVDLPRNVGAWPILAMREGARQQTGIILATTGAHVSKLAGMADAMAGPLSFDMETQLSAATPLKQHPDDTHSTLRLTGSMTSYTWGIDGKGWENRDTVKIGARQRVLISFQNTTMMAHPMHLHGHAFQVVAFNGKAFSGAMRDTVHVPPMAKVTIAFDADNPGQWLLHCHNSYHMEAGMITEVAYV